MVNRKTLLLTAGLVWFIAGVNIFIIGAKTWLIADMSILLKILYASLTFCIFFFAIFLPLYKKHSLRITNSTDKNHPLSFFDTKGWLIMVFMITLGITIRKWNILPPTFIAPFYIGLSTALSLTGVVFIRKAIFFKK